MNWKCQLLGHIPVQFDSVGIDAIEYDNADLGAVMTQLGRPARPATNFVRFFRCDRCGARRQDQVGTFGSFEPTPWWHPSQQDA